MKLNVAVLAVLAAVGMAGAPIIAGAAGSATGPQSSPTTAQHHRVIHHRVVHHKATRHVVRKRTIHKTRKEKKVLHKKEAPRSAPR